MQCYTLIIIDHDARPYAHLSSTPTPGKCIDHAAMMAELFGGVPQAELASLRDALAKRSEAQDSTGTRYYVIANNLD